MDHIFVCGDDWKIWYNRSGWQKCYYHLMGNNGMKIFSVWDSKSPQTFSCLSPEGKITVHPVIAYLQVGIRFKGTG